MKKTKLLVSSLLLIAACNITSFAGTWKQNDVGYWWQNDDGSYPVNTWQWIDGNQDGTAECYYFDGNGYMLSSTATPDGYLVNSDGAWVIDGTIQIQMQSAAAPAGTVADPAPTNTQAEKANMQNSQSNNQNTQTSVQNAQASSSVISSVPYDGYTIVVNTNSMKYHKPDCSTVARMLPEHFGYASSASDLIALGYTPCGWCHR